MIRGTVNDQLEAVISIHIQGPAGSGLLVDAVIDTGYTGLLALPEELVATLNLDFSCESEVTMADGTVRSIDVHEVNIFWNQGWRSVLVAGVGGGVLIGMQMLEGSVLRVAVEVGGEVIISSFDEDVG